MSHPGSTTRRGASARHRSPLLLLAACVVACAPIYAQEGYPSRPVRVIVPFPAGGVVDVIARAIGERTAQTMGQPVIVDNRSGASGSIGTELAARAAPDGHTLLLASPSHTTNMSLQPRLAWHPIKSFSAVTLVGAIPNAILVHPSLPVKTLPELVSYAKSRPGQLNYASAGAGSAIHLAAEMLRSVAGISIVHIPYKGQPEALTALLSAEVHMMPLTMALAIPRIKAGSVRALAVTSAKRYPATPDLPTVAESGYPGYEVSTWFGYLVPIGTPETLIARLNREIHSALATSEVEKKLVNIGMQISFGTPQAFARFLEADVARWSKVIRDAGIKAD